MNPQGAWQLAEVRKLAPDISAQAAAIESARRLPPSLIDAFRSAGIFRMFVAREYGGMALDLPDSLDVFETLSSADGSAGWMAVTWAHAAIYVSRLPKPTLDVIYADGPDVIWTNSMVLGGVAEAVEGGYRVSGRWPLVSGCEAADWMFAHCRTVGDEPSSTIAVAAPRDAWRIEDTWEALGLCGTGSLEINLEDAFIPNNYAFDVMNGLPQLEGGLYLSSTMASCLHFSAVAVGIAQAAIEDLFNLLRLDHHRLSAHAGLGSSAMFQTGLGWAEVEVTAARALMRREADHLHALSEAGDLPTIAGVAASQAAAWIATTCARTVDACLNLAGSTAIYSRSPLQRRLRDIHTLLQHHVMRMDHVTDAGRQHVWRCVSEEAPR